jgi:hypothetical protein
MPHPSRPCPSSGVFCLTIAAAVLLVARRISRFRGRSRSGKKSPKGVHGPNTHSPAHRSPALKSSGCPGKADRVTSSRPTALGIASAARTRV